MSGSIVHIRNVGDTTPGPDRSAYPVTDDQVLPLTSRPWALRTLRYAAIAIFLIAWQASGLVLPPIYIATPVRVAEDLGQMLGGPKYQLEQAFVLSFWELCVGLIISGVIGIALGIFIGRIRIAQRALNPLVSFANATPVIAVLPLMEIWFGVGKTAQIVFILIIGFWSLVMNTTAGISTVSPAYRDLGMSFGLTRFRQTLSIFIPAAMPFIFAGVRIALAQALVGMVLAGQEVGESGLGGLTEIFSTYFNTGHLIGAILTTTSLALLLFWLLRRVERITCPWIADLAAASR